MKTIEIPDDVAAALYRTASPGTEAPEMFQILEIGRDNGLVGEADTYLTCIIAMVRGQLVVLYGTSRGGKDFVLETAFKAFPSDYVYEWPNDESPTAPFYNAEEINGYPTQYFGDMAGVQDHQEKILKAFGEGNDADRSVTDISAAEGDEAKMQKLVCPRTTFATFATDNRNFDFNDWPEVRKRSFMIGVDGSKQQTENIIMQKAIEHADDTTRNVDPLTAAKIREYLGAIPAAMFTDHPNNMIVLPASREMAEQKPMPTEFPEARFDFERLMKYTETVTLMNHANRLTIDTDAGKKMLTTPGDVWMAMKIMGENMIISALNLTDEDQAVLRFLKESTGSEERSTIQQGLRADGYNINDRDVARSLKSMRENGYISINDNASGPNSYSLSPFHSVTQVEVGLDYAKIVEACREKVYEKSYVPDVVADFYAETFCTGEGLFQRNPYTGEAVDITEDTELQEVIDGATESAEETFDEPMFGSETSTNDDTADAQAEAKTQGTLAD
ncbi:hypothetical protein [Halonotius roseus]|uniref:Uncharacterized protein n=1 Tax=Halonotius roseus TaxID=2511997 RepID=A0A544QR28_9EURY|nr:hypothetical protein [Halonotius roseus]TQQ81892.1 hypothetical protein EWF95_02840 [Halonotius roseus]